MQGQRRLGRSLFGRKLITWNLDECDGEIVPGYYRTLMVIVMRMLPLCKYPEEYFSAFADL